ncbi:hypothetical protein DIPPA_04441 [Diplonema papillatum]|nr:hypothetical protein DIPPA_04441 [Diplonema papillatum]
MVATLCGGMDGLRAENDGLRTQLHEAKADAAPQQRRYAAGVDQRGPPARSKARSHRRRAAQPGRAARPAAPVHVVGTDSHLAFLLSPDT